MQSFVDAVEAKDLAAQSATLHPDVVFRSPAVFTPYVGREATMTILTAVMGVFEDFRYLGRFQTGDEHILRFTARVGGRELEGVDILRVGEDGLVTELTVMIRPLKGLIAVVEAMGKALATPA